MSQNNGWLPCFSVNEREERNVFKKLSLGAKN
jgi:hypothetical protein